MRGGLSTRDIEAAFADETGQSVLSKSAVSQVTEVLWQQYEALARRDLSEFKVLYLLVDGIAERLHLGQPGEAVLAGWAILEDGKKALLHLAPGTKEDTVSCRDRWGELKSQACGSYTAASPKLAEMLRDQLVATGSAICPLP